MSSRLPLHAHDLPARPVLSVIGCGYLGAVHAAAMTSLGFDVIGVEADPRKAALLAAGRAPFHEAGLSELLRSGVDSGRLVFTADIRDATRDDVHFVCVGTPQKDATGAADLSYVLDAVTQLSRALTKPALIVGKSTVPVGTADRLIEILDAEAADGLPAELIWNPEFLRESKAVQDTLHPDRVVLGGTTTVSLGVMQVVYGSLLDEGIPVLTTDLRTAELVKCAANAFLATKISFINAVAEVCELVGADVSDVADAIGHDVRIGRAFLDSGIGFGGGCLPKDIRALRYRAKEVGGYSLAALLEDVDSANSRRRQRVLDLTLDAVADDMYGRGKVALLGAAFKAETDDVRDSPALAVGQSLHTMGLDVAVYDPAARQTAAAYAPGLTYVDSVHDAVESASVVLVLTDWDEFGLADPFALAEIASAPVVIDGRNCIPHRLWAAAGWTVHRLGRPTVSRDLAPVTADV